MCHRIRLDHCQSEICEVSLRPLILCSALYLRAGSYSCQASVFEVPRHAKQRTRLRCSSWSGKWKHDYLEHKTRSPGISLLSVCKTSCFQALPLHGCALVRRKSKDFYPEVHRLLTRSWWGRRGSLELGGGIYIYIYIHYFRNLIFQFGK